MEIKTEIKVPCNDITTLISNHLQEIGFEFNKEDLWYEWFPDKGEVTAHINIQSDSHVLDTNFLNE